MFSLVDYIHYWNYKGGQKHKAFGCWANLACCAGSMQYAICNMAFINP